MFFLLRAAFWVCVVLVLLPSRGSDTSSEHSKMGAFDAISAATSAVSDMGGFCDRQPEACVTGAHAASLLGDRAQAGAKMVYDFLTERMNEAETGSITSGVRNAANSQHTLTPSDIAPAWRTADPSPAFRAPLPRPKPDTSAANTQTREKRT